MRETLRHLSIYDEDAHALARPPSRSMLTYTKQFLALMYSDVSWPTTYWNKLTWENVKKDMVVGFTLACVLIPRKLPRFCCVSFWPLDLVARLTLGLICGVACGFRGANAEGLSYASIALVPSVYGLYAAFVPNIVFGLVGSDK